MTLQFVDSFDHYTVTADITKKWTNNVNGGSISAGNGRNGTACFRATNTQHEINKTLPASATWIIGVAAKYATLNTNVRFFSIRNGATSHVEWGLDASGHLCAFRNGTLLATGTTVLSATTYYYIEGRVKISDTVGEISAQINGAAETFTFVTGTSTTQDTRNGATTNADVIVLCGGSGSNSQNIDFDDFYVCDDGGSTNNSFLGDVRVEALFPNGNGNYSQFTGSDGNSTDNYQLVDEASANGDTDYVTDSVSGHIDSYTMTNLTATSGTVYGVQTNMWARKDDAGTIGLKPFFRISAVDYARTTVNLTDTYLDRLAIEETSPAGGAWSVSIVNGLEFGQKIP